MDKRKAIQKITKEIEACKECKIGKSGKAVPGEGNPNADVVFIGEAPGKTEAATGRPFVGRSGKYLRSLIISIGLEEEDVFITSPVKYLPDGGTPTKQDIQHGKTHFDKQLAVIDPKIIVLLGNVAVQGVLGEMVPILKEHGKTLTKNGKTYFITLHPAAAIRFVKFRKLIEDDFQTLKGLVKAYAK